MTPTWSKGRIAFLVLGVICVGVGLALIIPSLVG
ncbi:hypothetical protein HD600_000692 [Microbacterium ginsengiterrae]|uniref:Uncharacterized protein n=1 Tax=Microbacterium ginsengiterrae TaxID=546115 RepID=A0A7W9FAK3_9MICO|nr:hypothetical protein [Microbacterium ginsengiterrae]